MEKRLSQIRKQKQEQLKQLKQLSLNSAAGSGTIDGLQAGTGSSTASASSSRSSTVHETPLYAVGESADLGVRDSPVRRHAFYMATWQERPDIWNKRPIAWEKIPGVWR